jgi:uncharacterized protein (DUF1697 family)
MTTYISILRGINVGGYNKIKMDVLKALCAGLGFDGVQTYIQSGNIIYRNKKADPKKLSTQIKAAIEKQLELDVPVITVTLEGLKQVVANNPFAHNSDITRLYVSFLDALPHPDLQAKLNEADYLPEKLQVVEQAVYLYCPIAYQETKLSNKFFETKLKVTATTRNWKTTLELLRMAATLE